MFRTSKDQSRRVDGMNNFAAYYRLALTAQQVQMYLDDLDAVDTESLLRAFLDYRRVPTNARFPLPAQLIDFCKLSNYSGKIENAVSCKACRDAGIIIEMKDGYEYAYRCTCSASENYCGLPRKKLSAII